MGIAVSWRSSARDKYTVCTCLLVRGGKGFRAQARVENSRRRAVRDPG